jgi:hypothetical protein
VRVEVEERGPLYSRAFPDQISLIVIFNEMNVSGWYLQGLVSLVLAAAPVSLPGGQESRPVS